MDTVEVPCHLWNNIVEFIEEQVDVRDGSYGEQVPNRALQLAEEIERYGL